MNLFRKAVSVLLAAAMVVGMLPTALFVGASESTQPEDNGTVYTIQNDYIRYSIDTVTGGFSVETLDGNPQKRLDDEIPLLFKENTESSGTSFTTVRIDGKDFIFGRDYSYYGINTKTHTPIVSHEGRLLTVQWDVGKISVLQEVALSAEDDMDLTGNVGISYTVVNNGTETANVGIRVLLDTALDSTVDAPYLMTDTETVPLKTEVEFSVKDGTLPSQICGYDSLENPSKMLYAFTKTFNNAAAKVDRLIVGHWRNLANTRYDYTPNEYCDFTNYSSTHRVPDAAIAYYWDESALAPGANRVAEIIYGVGNFSSTVVDSGVGINLSIDNKVRLNSAGNGYENNGEFTVTVNIDNAVDGAKQIKNSTLKLTVEDGITVTDSIFTSSYDVIEIGEVKSVQFKLKAENSDYITSKVIGVTLTGQHYDEENGTEIVNVNASRSVVVPGVKGVFSDLAVTYIAPEIVYTDGEKTIAMGGNFSPLKAIEGTDGWSVYLYHTTSDHKVLIDKEDFAFIDTECTQFTLITDETLHVGEYTIGFEFTDSQLVDGFGATSIKLAKNVQVSNDPKYRTRTYALMGLIRYNTDQYTFVPFATQDEYDNFLRGEGRYGGEYLGDSNGYPDIYGNFIAPFKPYDPNDWTTTSLNDMEVILIMRGAFKEIKGDDGEITYQANADDADIIINEILKYTGSKPLIVGHKFGEGTYRVSGDGKLSIIGNGTVWSDEWYYQVNNGAIVTLDEERCHNPLAQELELTLSGAGHIVQAIAGFAIDLRYGVMSSYRPFEDDITMTYGISFGGSISIPIPVPKGATKKDDVKKDDGSGNNGTNNGTNSGSGNSGTGNSGTGNSGTGNSGTGNSGTGNSGTGSGSGNSGTGSGSGSSTIGGTTTGPKHSWSKPETDFKKETNLDDGLLSASIDSVLYGNTAEKDGDGNVVVDKTEFIGIDTTVTVGLPQDLLGKLFTFLPGVYASITINTIENFYMLEAGLDIKTIQAELVFSLAQTTIDGKKKVVPDIIQFYIRDGLKIPLVPSILYISGLGGGISGLAETIGSNPYNRIAPFAVTLFTRLDLVEILVGDLTANISGSGISIDGELFINVPGLIEKKKQDAGTGNSGTGNSGNGNSGTGNSGTGNSGTGNSGTGNSGTGNSGTGNSGTNPGAGTTTNGAANSTNNPANRTEFANTVLNAVKSPITLSIGASMRWLSPVQFNAYGNVSAIAGLLKGGITITIAKDYFRGYGYLTICIPDAIPIIGGKEIGGVEGAITHQYIGANLRFLGTKIGVIVYWNGEYAAGEGIALRSLSRTPYPEYDSNTAYATNMSKLEKSQMRTFARSMPGSVSFTYEVAGQDSLIFEIPVDYIGVPTVNDIELVNPDGETITLIEEDGSGDGSFIFQSREDGDYIYISVTDPSLIVDGNWTVNVLNDEITVTTFDVYGVDDIPAITDVEFTRSGDVNSYDFDISWELDGESEDGGYIDVYLTKDESLLENIKTDDAEEQDIITLDRIRMDELASGSATVTMPDTMDSGTYYVVAMLSNDVGGMSTAISTYTFEFVNELLPDPVKSAKVIYAGDGSIYVSIEDADDIDYTGYIIEVAAADGSVIANNVAWFDVGDTIYFGGETELLVGAEYYVRVKTIREEEGDIYYYGTELVDSDSIVIPEVQKPVLLSVESNIEGTLTSESVFEATYTFDRPVWMSVTINETTYYSEGFADSHTITHELHDGDFTVEFEALSESKDSVTSNDFPEIENAAMGFTVDTVAPSLSISNTNYGENVAYSIRTAGTSVVFADENGSFAVNGITDVGADLTANGESVTPGSNGLFVYEGTLGEDENSRVIDFVVSDEAGNTAKITVTVVRRVQPVIESVEIYVNGAPVVRDAYGEAQITIKNGSRVTLTLVGKTSDGGTVVIDEPIWDVLYEKNNIIFNNGVLTARKAGETAVKAGISNGIVALTNGRTVELLTEDYVIFVIEESGMDELLADIIAAEENISEPYQAPEQSIDTYQQAIDDAWEVYGDIDSDEDDFTDAIQKLEDATKAFDKIKIVDKADLEAAIKAANDNIAVPKYAPEEAVKAYRSAIEAATAVSKDKNASAEAVANAIVSLENATKAFNEAKIADKSALKTAITAAQANIIERKFATDADVAAYRNAIDAAIPVSNDNQASPAQVASALETLEAATAAFNKARVIDKTELKAEIVKSEANIADPINAWQEAIDAYRAAIDAAKPVSNNDDADRQTVDGALKALKEATAVFNQAKYADKAGLKNAIDEAELNIANPGNATVGEVQTYRKAINSAEYVLDDPKASKEMIDNAEAALIKATKVFNNAKNRTDVIIFRVLHDITVEETVNGTVAVSQKRIYDGSSLTIISAPDEGYAVAAVVINGKDYGADKIITIPSVEEDLTISVKFELIPEEPEVVEPVWENPFTDVKDTDWFYEYVRWAHMNGITNGTSEDTFSPNATLTRAMLVTILWRSENCPEVTEKSGFTDVPSDSYYADAVAWAEDNGIVNGYGSEIFAPDDNITREQIAAIMYRFASYKGEDVSIYESTKLDGFKDSDSISDWAVDAMKYAVGSGLIKGRTEDMLMPLGNASRAESVTVLCRFFGEDK